MSDTPRTDAALQREVGDPDSSAVLYVARQLERELAESRAYAEQMRAALYAMFNASGRAEQYEAGKLARAALAKNPNPSGLFNEDSVLTIAEPSGLVGLGPDGHNHKDDAPIMAMPPASALTGRHCDNPDCAICGDAPSSFHVSEEK